LKAKQYKERIQGILVWFTVERLNIYNKKTRLYEKGDYICYYSFLDPCLFHIGELVKNHDCMPLMWKSEKQALKYARQHIKSNLNFNLQIKR
jgi:uncharacterized Tic20 family protein